MTREFVADVETGDRIRSGAVRSAAAVAEGIEPGATLAVSGFGSAGDPKAIPTALAERADAADLSLTVISGGSTGPAIDVDLVEAGAIARRYPFIARGPARDAINEGQIAFHDPHVADMSDAVAFDRLGAGLAPLGVDSEAGGGGTSGADDPPLRPDVAIVEAVAVGEDWLVPTTSVGQTPAYVAAADELVVEVNTTQPTALTRMHDVYRPERPPAREPIPLSAPGERIGEPRIRFAPGKLRAVVRSETPDTGYQFRDPTATDRAIANNLADLLERERERDPVLGDRLTLQFGVGSLGNALMGAIGEGSLADAPLAYYGEVIQDGLLDLLDRGALDAASATSLALSPAGREQLVADADRYAEAVVLRPSDVSNRASLIDRMGVVAVNSALAVDCYGHANATHIGGTRLVGGIGGGGDFTRNAHLSVIALPATASDGTISRVVPLCQHVDHTEHDVDVIVTEHGVADLRGLGPRERADAIIAIAGPDHRPALRRYAERARTGGGHVPHDLDRAFSWTTADAEE